MKNKYPRFFYVKERYKLPKGGEANRDIIFRVNGICIFRFDVGMSKEWDEMNYLTEKILERWVRQRPEVKEVSPEEVSLLL